MKFLVDECLSPRLAQMARDRGHHESSHVVWVGQGGVQDWNLITFVIEGDWTLVTKNSYDFRGPEEAPGQGGLYHSVPLHAGLVCLNGGDMDRQIQEDLFSVVLEAVGEQGDLINQGMEAMLLESGEIEIERYLLPPDLPVPE